MHGFDCIFVHFKLRYFFDVKFNFVLIHDNSDISVKKCFPLAKFPKQFELHEDDIIASAVDVDIVYKLVPILFAPPHKEVYFFVILDGRPAHVAILCLKMVENRFELRQWQFLID